MKMDFTAGDAGALTPQELQVLATERVHDGTLRCGPDMRLFGGPGVLTGCSLCSRPIGDGEMEYEIEPARPDIPELRFHFHIPCYMAWMDARRIDDSQRVRTLVLS